MRLDALANESRPIRIFVKEFSSKHQGLFQKVLHLFKKVLSSFSAIIFAEKKDEKRQKRKKSDLHLRRQHFAGAWHHWDIHSNPAHHPAVPADSLVLRKKFRLAVQQSDEQQVLREHSTELSREQSNSA